MDSKQQPDYASREAARQLLEKCLCHGIGMRLAGDGFDSVALEPETHPITDELKALVDEYGRTIHPWLVFEAKADKLLLASSRRLWRAWPQGCSLGSRWPRLEALVQVAYENQDIAAVKHVIEAREEYALHLFENHEVRGN